MSSSAKPSFTKPPPPARKPRKKKPVDPSVPKRPPGRPRKYPGLDEKQVKEIKRLEKQESKAKKLAEIGNPQMQLKNASIEMPLDFALPGNSLPVQYQDQPGFKPWTQYTLEQRQHIRNSIHDLHHFYIIRVPQPRDNYDPVLRITLRRPGFPPEELKKPRVYVPGSSNPSDPIEPFDTSRYYYYKVGPVLFPFISPHYFFNVVIEKRESDAKISSFEWDKVQRAINEPPRRVYMETFELNPSLSFEVWPPTAGYLIRVMRHCFREEGRTIQRLLLDTKSKVPRATRMPTNFPVTYQRMVGDVERKSRNMEPDMVFTSFEDLEEHMFYRPREDGFDPLDPNPATNGSAFHLFHERCVWLFRELFLGPEYFRMCKYFHPLDLVGQTAKRIKTMVTPEILDPEKSPKRVGSVILNKFLRPDRIGIKFRDGEALVDFINDYVSDESVLNTVLPPFADVGAFGTKRSFYAEAGAANTSSGPAYHNPLIDGCIYGSAARRNGNHAGPLIAGQVPVIIRNPSSRDAVAAWYDSLRKLYLDIVALPFSTRGDLFPSYTIQPLQVEYMEFLISRGFIEVYPNVQATSDAKYLIEKHFDMQTTQKYSLRVITDKLADTPSSPESSSASSQAAEKDESAGLCAELEAELFDQQKKDAMKLLVKNTALDLPVPEEVTTVFAAQVSVMTKESRVRKQMDHSGEPIDWQPGSEDVPCAASGDIFGKVVESAADLYSNTKSPAKRARASPAEEALSLLALPSSLIEPSAVGAREPLVIYPKVAAEMAHTICDSILSDIIVSRYVNHVQRNIDLCLRNAFCTENIKEATQKRDWFSDEEYEFLKQAKEKLAKYEFYGAKGEIVLEKFEDMILTREPVTNFKPLETILDRPHRTNAYGPCYRYNAEAVRGLPAAAKSVGVIDSFFVHKAEELLDFPIVLVDYPYSYADKKRPDAGPDLLDLACAISTFNLGPEEVHLLPVLTEDSLYYNRTASDSRFVVLKELEKWPIQHLKEAIQTTFYNWRASRLASGKCTLWVFADFHALDTGALSVLLNFAKGRTYVKQYSIREYLVKDSFLAGVAARIQLNEPTGILTEEDVDTYMVISKTDEHWIIKQHLVTDPVTNTPVVHYNEELPLVTISLDQLYLYRDPAARPQFAKVQLSSISDWRQLYTLTCYVTTSLVLVGTERVLQHIYEVSREHFHVVLPPVVSVTEEDRATAAEIVEIQNPADPSTTIHGRLRFKPSSVVDVWSSMRINSACLDSSASGATVVHL